MRLSGSLGVAKSDSTQRCPPKALLHARYLSKEVVFSAPPPTHTHLVSYDVPYGQPAVSLCRVEREVPNEVDHGMAHWFVVEEADGLGVPPAARKGGGGRV